MKVAIITQHRVFNYGSALQTYATQVAVQRVGHDAQVIDYFSEQRTYARQFFALPKGANPLSLRGSVGVLARLPGNFRKKWVFQRFLNKNICLTKRKYITHGDLRAFPPAADVYMTGSDQVWNSDYNEGIDPSYYLDFGEDTVRRVSYAASIGMDAIPEKEEEQVKRLLSKYDAISVREIKAKDALNDIGVSCAEVVLDPTLLLTQSDWEKIEKTPKQKGYILVMVLYGEECGIPQIAQQISAKTGLPILELLWNPLKKRPWKTVYGCSPEEFLGYVHNAGYIVTNSFHVTSFAINYKKTFVVARREKYNSRIESLLHQLGIADRYILPGELDEKCLTPIDYGCVGDKLRELREQSYKILSKMIGE